MVNPDTVIGDEVLVPVKVVVPSVQAAVYPVIAEPPLDDDET